jgi:hypothetical protein
MDRRQVCVANVQYKKPGGERQMKNLIRYLTFRESRDETAHFVRGVERWVDHGMGRTVNEIANHCEAYQSQHVLLFSLVINPNPDLVAMVALEERERFVRELTEHTVEDFFDARGIENGVEWSAVMHHRLTNDPQSPGLHNPHMHVMLPGTYYDPDEGIRKPLYFSKNRQVNHIEMLHEICQQHSADLLDHYIGPDWEQRYDALEAARERQTDVTREQPHGSLPEIGAVWSGVRRNDEQTSAVGVYGYFHDDLDKPDARVLRFRALIAGLPHDEAEIIASHFADLMKRDVNTWHEEVQRIKSLNRSERAAFVSQIPFPDHEPPEIALDLAL